MSPKERFERLGRKVILPPLARWEYTRAWYLHDMQAAFVAGWVARGVLTVLDPSVRRCIRQQARRAWEGK